MKYVLIVVLLSISLFIYGCENTRHSIGVTAKPLSEKMDESLKLNYKIIFGKVRPKEDDDD